MKEGKITTEELGYFDRLPKAGSQSLNEYCAMVYLDPWFDKIVKEMTIIQKESTFQYATTERELLNGRAVVEGINLIEEFFKKYSQRLKGG